MGLLEEIAAIDYWVVAVIVMNFTSSVGVVFLNKALFQFEEFAFSYTLVLLHFVFTFFGMVVCALAGVFQPKRIPMSIIIPLSLSFCGFVVLTNLSLEYNSVGFYQLAKTLTTPVVMIIESLFYNKSHTSATKLSMLVVCIGVIEASVKDIKTNILGTVIALTGVLVTSLYQIWVGRFQSKFNSMQLLLYQAPVSAIFLLIGWPWMEDSDAFWAYPGFNSRLWQILIVSSCLSALFVNLSTFLLIGKTSAVTYNAVGHGKLVVILAGGFLIFGQSMTIWNLIGCVTTLVGLVWYTRAKLQLQVTEQSQPPQKIENEKSDLESAVTTTKDPDQD